MQFSIGGIDLTKYIVDETYDVNMEYDFQEWKDSNSFLHRKYERSRIKGAMQIVCSEKSGMSPGEFLDIVHRNTKNDMTMMCRCYVVNIAQERVTTAYYTITQVLHRDNVDIFNLEIMER